MTLHNDSNRAKLKPNIGGVSMDNKQGPECKWWQKGIIGYFTEKWTWRRVIFWIVVTTVVRMIYIALIGD